VVAYLLWEQVVAGSIPAAPTNLRRSLQASYAGCPPKPWRRRANTSSARSGPGFATDLRLGQRASIAILIRRRFDALLLAALVALIF
jgi:hypothetical protein